MSMLDNFISKLIGKGKFMERYGQGTKEYYEALKNEEKKRRKESG